MEQIYNGMLPLGLSQRLNEPVMMLEKANRPNLSCWLNKVQQSFMTRTMAATWAMATM